MRRKPIDTTSPAFKARAEQRRRTWTVTVYDTFEDVKAAEYRFWATQPTCVVVATISDMTTDAYALRGIRVSRLQRASRAAQ